MDSRSIFLNPDTLNEYLKSIKKSSSNIISQEDYKYFVYPSIFAQLVNFRGKKLSPRDYQVPIMNSTAKSNVVGKARQLGFSTICIAGRTLAKAYTSLPYTYKGIICSYNLTEARQKIKAIKEIQSGLSKEIRLKTPENNKLGIVFENGNEIYSVFSPRGHENAEIFIDEYPYHADQDGIYLDALPIIEASPTAQLFVGGTPKGTGNKFHDIFSRKDGKFTDYTRYSIYWWDNAVYCKDVARARREAKYLSTTQRVEEFGTDALKRLFNSFLLEDFQQEYEIYFSDEASSYFPYYLIQKSMEYYTDLTKQEKYPETLEDIGKVLSGRICAGFDVGRTKNASEFYAFDHDGQNLKQIYNHTMDNVPFEDQMDFLRNFLSIYQEKTDAIYIDKNNIGFHLAEKMEEEYPSICKGINLTNESKSIMATATKINMVNGTLQLLPDKEVMQHFHSIKQTTTLTGKTKYDAGRNEKHHADKFWAVALANYALSEDRGIVADIIC